MWLLKDWKLLCRLVKILSGTAILGFVAYLTKEVWRPLWPLVWYDEYRGHACESKIHDAVYKRLVTGSQVTLDIDTVIPRHELKEVSSILTPRAKRPFYPVIIGEQGTGKTSLILLAINDMKVPKGVIYVDCPQNKPGYVAEEMKKALDFNPPTKFDPDNLPGILDVFSRAAAKIQAGTQGNAGFNFRQCK